MTNDDFRKLMMTPRPSGPSSASQSSGASAPKRMYENKSLIVHACGWIINDVFCSTSSSKQRERQHRRSVDEEDEERRQKRKRYIHFMNWIWKTT